MLKMKFELHTVLAISCYFEHNTYHIIALGWLKKEEATEE